MNSLKRAIISGQDPVFIFGLWLGYNGLEPVWSSYHMSICVEYSEEPKSTSGGLYHSVTTSFEYVLVGTDFALAKPGKKKKIYIYNTFKYMTYEQPFSRQDKQQGKLLINAGINSCKSPIYSSV